jgi:putative oxidoreductase
MTGRSGDLWSWVLESKASRATVLIRAAAGIIFASEGVQKFVYPDALGAGRFAKIGIPAPQLTAPFVGVVEIACGLLLCAGLFVRPAAVVLLVDMLVAIASTKIPILIGHGYLGFADPAGKVGIFGMLHEARTDLAMLLSCAFLLAVGAGAGSLDSLLLRQASAGRARRHRLT